MHLVVAVADGRFLGSPKINPETGQTQLETLYDNFVRRRPRHLSQSRLELIWRSVATLHSAREKVKDAFGNEPGSVLVINVNRKVFWTTLRLLHWSPNGKAGNVVHIARRAEMNECRENESWMTQRANFVESNLTEDAYQNIDALKKWTRSIEILSTGMSSESLAEFGLNIDALEHWSWPMPDGSWKALHQKLKPLGKFPPPVLPKQLEEDIQAFTTGMKGTPLAIVVESPMGVETTSRFARIVQNHILNIPAIEITGQDASKATMDLALALERDPNVPAWLDEVASIELEARLEPANGKTSPEWIPIVPRNQAIPAGETYHARSGNESRVTLAPGIQHVLLHLRRGYESNWNERYTRHAIAPSDHERVVEPLARVRPLSGDARIEIEEHLPSGKHHLLTSVRWSEMEKTSPPELGSIPELYVFKSDRETWRELRSLLEQVIRFEEGGVDVRLKDRIYKTAKKKWDDKVFPLGSDGLPPEPEESGLLTRSAQILLKDLEDHVKSKANFKPWHANRLHLPLTWLFTGCPEKTVEILLQAVLDAEGPEGTALCAGKNEYSAWSIYSGIGRAIRGDGALRVVFDDLLGVWERKGGAAQDKYLLAAVTHPLARRVSVRFILGESKERFDRVARFLKQQLNNLIMGNHDPRPDGKRPNLELRYITMGYRGLCQIRYLHQDWFSHAGEDAKLAYKNLCEAKGKIRGTFEKNLVERTAPYLIGKGEDPAMPSGF